MSKLKDRILESAWELFREKGYENVSLRVIADHAGTTIGNLTYHFPQKEDLLMAMQLSTRSEALPYSTLADSPEGLLRELYQMADLSESCIRDRSFFYCSLLRICQDVPALRERMEETRNMIYDLYRQRFLALREAGYMRQDISESEYDNLVRTIILCFTGWMIVNNTFHDRFSQASIAQTLKDLYALCLTEKGRQCVRVSAQGVAPRPPFPARGGGQF